MAKNFENRIDYVDIKAYGVGKVKIVDREIKRNPIQETEMDIEGE